ncbi:hypothetical protein [Nesterenkonia sp.]|uniref:hypothetical protein n=1 Tax=Nesterenkonia sp. TaxID=704201 RepID=UPI0026076275|nr:hypothetical protein [Nesterenkonia sp.]
MRRFTLYWPAFRAGTLLHLTWGVTVLALAVIIGPPLAWLVGGQVVTALIALVAVSGRALAGYLTARQLWAVWATPGLVLRTTLSAAGTGYAAVFFPLSVLGVSASTAMVTAGASATLFMVLDCLLALAATASGALIASRSKRRYRRRLFDASQLPVVKEISESFAEHRAKARLNV